KARDLSESAKRFVWSCNMNGSLQASSPSGSCPSTIRVRRSLDQGLRSSAWIAKQSADRHQRTEYKFWVVQQATLAPPKSFRDSQRTPADLNRAVARACRLPDNKLHTTSYRRRIAPCASVSPLRLSCSEQSGWRYLRYKRLSRRMVYMSAANNRHRRRPQDHRPGHKRNPAQPAR